MAWSEITTVAVPPVLSVPLGVALATAMGRAATLRVWSAAAAAVAGLLRVPAMPLAQILAPLLLPVPIIIPLAGALRAPGFAAQATGAPRLPWPSPRCRFSSSAASGWGRGWP